MGGSDRETAEHATPDAPDRDVLCGSVFVDRAFMVELPAAGEVTIGRDAGCDLQLGHPSVSRLHARLEMRGDHGTVTDEKSRNGTFLNGARIGNGTHRIGRGDELSFGSARLALLARGMVPASVRAVLVRSALLARLDQDVAAGGDLDVLALRTPERWYASDRVAAWLASLPQGAYVGMLSEQALVVVSTAGAVPADALRDERLEIDLGRARQRDVRAPDGHAIVTAALRALAGARSTTLRRASSAPVATSAAMLRVYEEAAKIAPAGVSVLITGETGVGKEVLARFLHERSGRRGPLVSVNTAALPEALVESELFGHERGAFSGAVTAKTGLIEAAGGGTLFLDEIGDLPLSLQAKLLRVLEERAVRRVGATQERKVDVRVVAATHRDLERAVAEGAFRQDLLFRLNACTLAIPPLRERAAEIDRLADELLAEEARAAGAPKPLRLAEATREILRRYAWPGNVRELRNVLERGAALARAAGELRPEHLPDHVRAPAPRAPASPEPAPPPSGGDVRDSVKDYERRRIVEALAQAGGNQSQAAKLLGLPRRTLAYKMARLGIRVPE